MTRLYRLVILPIAFLAAMRCLAQDGDPGASICASIFKADMHDTDSVFSDDYHFMQFQTLLKTANFKSYNQYSSTGLKLGVDVPIADIIVGFSGDYKTNDAKFQEELNQFLSSTFQQNVSRDVFRKQTSQINSNYLSVANTCVTKYFDNLKDKLKLSTQVKPSSYGQFLLNINGYIPPGVASFKVTGYEPRPDIKCTFDKHPVSFPKSYPTGNTAYNCTKDSNRQLYFTVITNLGNSPPILLPATPPPPPTVSGGGEIIPPPSSCSYC